MIRFALGVLCGIAGVVLVALAGDPRQKRGLAEWHDDAHDCMDDITSLDLQSRRFDDEMDGVQPVDPYTLQRVGRNPDGSYFIDDVYITTTTNVNPWWMSVLPPDKES